MATGQDVVTLARREIGPPHEYHFGSAGPTYFDCSGLVHFVYQQLGITTPRTTQEMIAKKSPLVPITENQLQPGDLVFSHWGTEGPSHHVGIYTGHGTLIEAPEPGKFVQETTLGPTYRAHVDAYRRVPGLTGASASPTNVSGGDPLTNLVVGGVLTGMKEVKSSTDALENVGTALASVAQSAASGAGLAERIRDLISLPTYFVRGMFLAQGILFLVIGMWLITKELRD